MAEELDPTIAAPEEAAPARVNAFDPRGNLVSLPAEKLPNAVQQFKYRPASDQETEHYFKQKEFDTTGQKAAAFVEGALDAGTFGIAPLIETGTGLTTDEDINYRREFHPYIRGAGSILGLGLSSALIPGGGAAGLLEKGGLEAGKAVGLGAEAAAAEARAAALAAGATAKEASQAAKGVLGTFSVGERIGSKAVQGSVETGLFQLGDETSKYITDSPDASVVNVGLAAIMGGVGGAALGSISPLWSATTESKLAETLRSFKNRATGAAGSAADDVVEQAIATSGVPVEDVLKGVMKKDGLARDFFYDLRESPSRTGRYVQEKLGALKDNITAEIGHTFEKGPEDLQSLSTLSDTQVGTNLQGHLSQELEQNLQSGLLKEAERQDVAKLRPTASLEAIGANPEVFNRLDASKFEEGQALKDLVTERVRKLAEPSNELYKVIGEKFPKVAFDAADRRVLKEELSALSSAKGYDKNSFGEEGKLLKKLIKDVDLHTDLESLRKLRSNFNQTARKGQMSYLAGKVGEIFENAEYLAMERKIGMEAPELLTTHQLAKTTYGEFKTTLNELNDRLKLGRWSGEESFIHALEDLKPEDVLQRLSKTNDAGLLGLLDKELPEVAQSVRDIQMRNLIKGVAEKDATGALSIDADVLYDRVTKLSPEMREFALKPGALESLENLRQVSAAGPSVEEEFAKNVVSQLNSKLKLGKIDSPAEFLSKVAQLSPEVLLAKLNQPESITFLGQLSDQFPKTFQTLKDYMLDDLFKSSGGDKLNATNFLKRFNALQPELRQMLLPAEKVEKLAALEKLQEVAQGLAQNYSKTSPFLMRMLKHVPAGITASVAAATGHNPALGFLFGEIGQLFARDVPDALKLAMMKMLSSKNPIDGGGFKAAVDVFNNAFQGEKLMGKGARALFKAGEVVVPSKLIPTERDRKKLDDRLMELQLNPEKLVEMDGKTAHYLPEHQSQLAATSARAANYLNSVRPKEIQPGPLDKPLPMSSGQKQQWNRTLDVAQQPLLVLDHIKNGTLQVADVMTLRAVHPQVYQRLSDHLHQALIDHLSDGQSIPHPVKISMSLFLGHPLENTFQPQAIQGLQAAILMGNAQKGGQQGSGMHPMAAGKLNKLPGMYMTPQQARISQTSRLK
jgi:hypothetical protein